MSSTRLELREAVLHRLGDPTGSIWTAADVDRHLQAGYQILAQTGRVFEDWTYLENLPATFSYTAAWELVHGHVPFDAGLANFTYEDERRMWTETLRVGPANATSPFEVTDGLLEASGASTAIPATATLPRYVTELERVTWDGRGIDALRQRVLETHDTRYETTEGEVYGYLWQKDGVRTLRKVRVPAAQADVYDVIGSWGLCRTAAEWETP